MLGYLQILSFTVLTRLLVLMILWTVKKEKRESGSASSFPLALVCSKDMNALLLVSKAEQSHMGTIIPGLLIIHIMNTPVYLQGKKNRRIQSTFIFGVNYFVV